MHKSQSVTITVDNPCNQSWDEMTPDGRGRFCTACQKTVIDFTAWSDAALYQFFAKDPANVCGRFLFTQLDKPIRIPHQPQSRLYRITVALGLTLICTQTPATLAQNRPPKVSQVAIVGDTQTIKLTGHGHGSISGNIVDDKKEPLINATIQVYQGGELKGGSVTDYDGNYIVKPLEPGSYNLLITYAGFDSVMDTKILVSADQGTILNAAMKRNYTLNHIVTGGMGLVHSPRRYREIEVKAEVYGRITDEHGRSLAGAEIQVYRDGSLKATRNTNANGEYDVTKLAAGIYELRILHNGHQLAIIANVQLFSGKTEQNVTISTSAEKNK